MQMKPDLNLKRVIGQFIAGASDHERFRNDLWGLWSYLYSEYGFPYDTPGKDGIFFVASRSKYSVGADGGFLATYSKNLTREERYSRDLFNMKTLDVIDAGTATPRTLFFLSYEAPLLRPPRGRLKGIQRVHADLVAMARDNSLVIIEAKDAKESADPPASALAQAYAYAFFLSCHVANRAEAVLEHAKSSLDRFQGAGNPRIPQPESLLGMQYAVIAPRGYFERTPRAPSPDPDEILKALNEPLALERGEGSSDLELPRNPTFVGFVVSEMRSYGSYASLSGSL